MVIQVILCILIGYFLGTVSPSYIIASIRGYDPVKDGSGNPGASNTLILAGKALGLLAAVLDILKAFAAWRLCAYIFPDLRLAGQIAGVSAIFGHMFPVWYKFKGGKGLACLGGVCLAHSPWTFLILLGIALVICLLTNYIAVMTVVMAFVVPIYYLIVSKDIGGSLVLFTPAVPMLLKHRINFQRIRNGTELRLSYLIHGKKEMDRVIGNHTGNKE